MAGLRAWWSAHLTPKRAAAIRRFTKSLVFQIAGSIAVNAGALVAYGAGLIPGMDPATVTVASWLATSAGMAIQKARGWKDDAPVLSLPKGGTS